MRLFFAALALAALASTACDAKTHHHPIRPALVCSNADDIMRPCMPPDTLDRIGRDNAADFRHAPHRPSQAAPSAPPDLILAHPLGCPARAFCACGAAVRIFGRPVRALWLAASWFRFPRAAPARGMVAVKRHHVFVLEQNLGGDSWLAYDANSGGHATRLHARSIAGFVIVNPMGAS